MNRKLKIAVTQSAPFISESNGKYSGFEIELWETIAKEIGADFEYKKYNFQELIPLVANKKADIALGAITINEKREEIVDFSHPIFHSGLRILLSKNSSKINIISTINAFLIQGYRQLVKPLIIALLILLIFGNLLWFSEKSGGSLSPQYFPGVFQATWLSISEIAGSDSGMFIYELRSWHGRIVLTLARIASFAALGLLIGEISAFITTRRMKSAIEGVNDLRGKIVATVKNTTSESVLKKVGAIIVPVTKIEEAYNKVLESKVEAVIFDAPILESFVLEAGANNFKIVGELFDEQDYGIAIHEKSLLREEINRAILSIIESGYYDTLHKKYFG